MTEMRRQLIINADDLGLSEEVSLGIEQSYTTGVVSSASLMANMPGFDEGVQVALRNPDLGIGVHLNLIRGKPITSVDDAFPLLANGKFIDNIFHIGRLSANPDYLRAAENEYRAQIEKILDSGVKPDHLDFEKHHGIWKSLYTVADRLAKEYKLAIRSYSEPLFFVMQNLPFAGYNKFWNSLHLKFYNTFWHRGFTSPSPDYFFGQTHIGEINKSYLLSLIKNLPAGISELMTHPGHNSITGNVEKAIGKSWITDKREEELKALTDSEVIEKLDESGIEVTTFKEGLM